MKPQEISVMERAIGLPAVSQELAAKKPEEVKSLRDRLVTKSERIRTIEGESGLQVEALKETESVLQQANAILFCEELREQWPTARLFSQEAFRIRDINGWPRLVPLNLKDNRFRLLVARGDAQRQILVNRAEREAKERALISSRIYLPTYFFARVEHIPSVAFRRFISADGDELPRVTTREAFNLLDGKGFSFPIEALFYSDVALQLALQKPQRGWDLRSLTFTFKGVVPDSALETIEQAVKLKALDKVFLAADCTGRLTFKSEQVPQARLGDPLILGRKDKALYYLGSFEPTSFEQWLAAEMTM